MAMKKAVDGSVGNGEGGDVSDDPLVMVMAHSWLKSWRLCDGLPRVHTGHCRLGPGFSEGSPRFNPW
jgi:hypothetical protein